MRHLFTYHGLVRTALRWLECPCINRARKRHQNELRCPDPAANPYLCFAVMLQAGLKGIDEAYELPAPIEENIFAMDGPTPR